MLHVHTNMLFLLQANWESVQVSAGWRKLIVIKLQQCFDALFTL